MNKMKAYELSIGSVILRFYFMMLIVLAAGFSGYWLLGLLALPILVSIMVGVKVESNKKINKAPRRKNVMLPKRTKENFSEVA